MAAEGLTRSITSFTAPEGAFVLRDAEGARAVRSACPALTAAAVHIRAPWRTALAAVRALGSCAAESTVELGPAAYSAAATPAAMISAAAAAAEGDSDFASFAAALTETLGACSVKALVLGVDYFADLGALFGRLGPDAAAAERAATSLGAALADPLRGPREVRVVSKRGGQLCFPAAAHVARALTSESLLRVLSLGGRLSADGLRELAAALAPGRSRVEKLTVSGIDLREAEGCVHMLVVLHQLLIKPAPSGGVALLLPASRAVCAGRH